MKPKPDPADAGEKPLDGHYWEGCYQRGDMRWDKGAPSPGLVDFLAAHPDLPRGTVCSPGCGTGHDVRAWARAGFAVTGVDIAPSAVRMALQKTSPAQGSISYQQADFLHDTPSERFDWLWEHTLFCAIHPSARDAYADAVLRWLKPGGHFLAVHYLIPDEDGPPFGTTKDELLQRFQPRLRLLDSWVPRSYPNRTGLELMLWWEYPS